MIHNFQNSLPCAEHGFGLDFNHYVSGRIAADVVSHGGISALYYVGKQGYRRAGILSGSQESAFAKVGRIQIIIDGRNYYPEFHHTFHYPFGYRSECELEGVHLRHELLLEENTLFQIIRVLDNPERKSIRARALLHGHVLNRLPDRNAENWTIQPDGSMQMQIHDPSGSVRLRFLCSVPCRTDSRHEPFKYYMEATTPGELFAFAFQFDSTEHPDFASAAARIDLWEKEFREGVRFFTGNAAVDSALNNVVSSLKSLMVKDRPGAIRASQSYWIWGWDSMVWAEAFPQLNRLEQMAGVLDFYCRTASPQSGIFHEMHPDLRAYKSMAFAPQCLYAVMLYQYLVYSGRTEVAGRYLRFAEEIVSRAGEFEVAGSGLLRGVSLYPDHPEDLDQDGDDISVFNNSIYYQALRSLEELERAFENPEKSMFYRTLAERTRRGFERFYDPQAGYFCDSLSARDFSMRRHYPVYAILFVTEFADELLENKRSAVAEFMNEHFSTRQGARILPLDDPAFLRDGNQLGMYMPSTERFYRVMSHAMDPVRNLEKWKNDIICNWKLLTLPEALTCEYENHGITPDNPGRKQFFTLKPWVGNWFLFALGIHCDLDGIVFASFADAGTEVSGLHWRGKTLCIRNCGSSGKVSSIRINGKAAAGTDRVLWSELPALSEIVVLRQ